MLTNLDVDKVSVLGVLVVKRQACPKTVAPVTLLDVARHLLGRRDGLALSNAEERSSKQQHCRKEHRWSSARARRLLERCCTCHL